MLAQTDHPHAPWWVLSSDNKQTAQLNALTHFLGCVPYEDLAMPPLALPPRESDSGYTPPPPSAWRFVPSVYTEKTLTIAAGAMLQAASLEVAELALGANGEHHVVNVEKQIKAGPEH